MFNIAHANALDIVKMGEGFTGAMWTLKKVVNNHQEGTFLYLIWLMMPYWGDTVYVMNVILVSSLWIMIQVI